jgi:hypothetical protein
MNEEELLDDIFDCGKKWKGKYPIRFCDLCDVFTIGCTDKKCHGSSCNGHSCDECRADHFDFDTAKTYIPQYLNEEEKKVYEKIIWLKRYMKESLLKSEYSINWKRMKQQGELCRTAEKIFEKEIAESFAAQPDVKFGDY